MTTIALSTGSLYSYGLARVLNLAAEAGFDAVEIMVDERWDTRQPDYLRRLCQESGLPIAAVHNPFLPNVPGWPADPLGRLRLSVQVAREVIDVLEGRAPRYPVNATALSSEELEFLQPYIDLANRLGTFYAQYAENNLARIEMTYAGIVAEHDTSSITAAALTD